MQNKNPVSAAIQYICKAANINYATVASNMLPGIEQGKITTIHGATLLPPTGNIVAGNSCQRQCCLVYVGLNSTI